MDVEELDRRYLDWLCCQVSSARTEAKIRSHYFLLEQLHETIFVAFVPHDENRIEDGRDLRYEFLAETPDVQGDPSWTRSPCTMLELLVVLSRALAFEMDEQAEPWFWHLIEVLELEQFNDDEYDNYTRALVADTLDRVIWRQYGPDGVGGLFPLRDASRDQRDVELWYQLNAYLLEQF